MEDDNCWAEDLRYVSGPMARVASGVGLLYSATIERQFPHKNPGSASFLLPFFDYSKTDL